MAIAALILGELTCVASMLTFEATPAWYAWLILPLICLAGPLFALLGVVHLGPVDAVPGASAVISVYGLSVAWFFWKQSGWSKALFILLSVLWVLFGCMIAASPI